MGHAASPSLYDYASGDPVNSFDPDGRINWWQVGKGTVGAVANGALALGGLALSEAGVGVPLAIYGSYQFGANVGNIINGFRDAGEGPTGPVQTVAQGTMLIANVNPNSMAWKRTDIIAEGVDVLIPTIVAGQIDTRLICTQVGEDGTMLGAVQRFYIPPEAVYPTIQLAVRADQLITASDFAQYGYKEWQDAKEQGNSNDRIGNITIVQDPTGKYSKPVLSY
jgi:hypothetical protein